MGSDSASRTVQQIVGDRGELIAKTAFPNTWVVRDLPSDYGLDLNIEVFGRGEGSDRLLTTGQHLYAQVKSTGEGLSSAYVGGSRLLTPSVPMKTINTVAAMGAAVPVLLLYVDVQTKAVYWLCLNDYIDKVLRPGSPDYSKSDSVTVYIDPRNLLDSESDRFWMVEALSQRAKLYAAFHLFTHMYTLAKHRIRKWHYSDDIRIPDGMEPQILGSDPEMQHLAGLLDQAVAMDIWKATNVGSMRWDRLVGLRTVLVTLQKAIAGLLKGSGDPNEVFRSVVGTYKGVELTSVFHEVDGITPLHPFLENLKVGFKLLAGSSAGYEGNPRWQGLHVTAPSLP